ncbi:MAG TPA: cytochrome C oxidase subunit IV family protein [Planctomycetota bacterium]|nr:cytochrome C oxidase subunit IV family protein [Planctomycetota bacterium]
MAEKYEFSPHKVFVWLLVLTLLEVVWALVWPESWSVMLMRSGLVVFALWKGYLIFTYFMHMKWEGLICKGMVGFTVPLVAIIMLANMPDTSFNSRLKHPIGSQYMQTTGEVVGIEEAATERHYGDKRFMKDH